MSRIGVDCRSTNDGWSCAVTVDDGRGPATGHTVHVTRADLARYAPGAGEPADLVRRSFEFLLAREPKEAILRTFDLPVIGRYFPDYESDIRP